MRITEENYRTNRGHLRYLEELRQLSIKNRNNPTEAEYMMWQFLRKNKYGINLSDKNQFLGLLLIFIAENYC
jgi:hypothetical protein